ncbi:hypothetical protein CONPUDRAFT_63639 [Coniophora puteana RWD-64-598 SS2]|uniref:Conserved oligomeric Golgi complex subunit 7 n=1 Tax=Coniophora puteana (strain RWD-64-598) TaxID=741705 RepID=A0A5M3MDN0_CONPW|nr:uncharacterized protein CONPUDRAFT_63639 [Coniophora puteana RWD-64-598 SS2]EIW76715.1 hypothetical protein CONPUDRAFT_63639 [Coniophora puteana RWD-64-598 SS2]
MSTPTLSTSTLPGPVQELETADDALAYLNNTLLPDASLTALEGQLADLLASFDSAAESTSAALERTLDDAARSVPRLAYDLHFMRDGALGLASLLSRTRSAMPAASAADSEAQRALADLARLDRTRTRMEAARGVLREAESWSTLEGEVGALLSEKTYEKAAERLADARKSMVVFSGTPEYEPRRALLVSLQNELEAALSAALVAAFSAQDVALCKRFYGIFVRIDREGEFRNYYYGSRRTTLVASWTTCDTTVTTTGTDTPTAGTPITTTAFSVQFWTTWLSSFLGMLNVERHAIPSIFPDPQATFSTLVSSTLSALQPSLAQRLAGLSLSNIVTVYEKTEEFARSVERVVEKVRMATTPVPSASPNTHERTLSRPPSHARRRSSMRMSVSFRANSASSAGRGGEQGPGGSGNANAQDDQDAASEWELALFHAFLDFQADYGVLERRFLLDELARSTAQHPQSRSSSWDVEEGGRRMREEALDVFAAAEDALARCIAFTHGFAAVGLVQAVDGCVSEWISRWKAVVEAVSKASANASNGAGAGAADVGATDGSEGELADLDYTARDWADIQRAMRFLGAGRATLERVSTCEGKIRKTLSQVHKQHYASAGASAASRKGHIGMVKNALDSPELGTLLASCSANAPPTSTPTPTPAASLLTAARGALADLAGACQVSLQRVLLAPLLAHLTPYASLPIWAERVPSTASTAGGLVVPTFSRDPTPGVQRLAEGLLNLPRLFDVVLGDEGVPFLPTSASSSATGPGHSEDENPEAVVAAWLASLGQVVLAHVVTTALPRIVALSESGRAQLVIDLEYLGNVLHALGEEEDGVLQRWAGLVRMDDAAFEQAFASRDRDDNVMREVVRMRRAGRDTR